ncbi:hypothetical protein [Actinoplanes sp. NPDC049118]|uniref:hypothetical protein n=1 Tax=Actinoplanes sp. NPDC049118 TaxID=3155769 RepID=UPI003407BDCB
MTAVTAPINDSAVPGEGQESEATTTDQTQAGGEPGETDTAGSTLTHEQALTELTRVRGEAANYRTRLRQVEKQLGEAKTPEEFEAALAEAKAKNAELEQSIARNDVARRFGLPDELAARLRGATVQELETDAKALQKFAAPTAPANLSGGLDPADDTDGEIDPRVLARRYGGRRR